MCGSAQRSLHCVVVRTTIAQRFWNERVGRVVVPVWHGHRERVETKASECVAPLCTRPGRFGRRVEEEVHLAIIVKIVDQKLLMRCVDIVATRSGWELAVRLLFGELTIAIIEVGCRIKDAHVRGGIEARALCADETSTARLATACRGGITVFHLVC